MPTNDELLGESARQAMPYVRQVFISRSPELSAELSMSWRLSASCT